LVGPGMKTGFCVDMGFPPECWRPDSRNAVGRQFF
jgi:hypothetical protein